MRTQPQDVIAKLEADNSRLAKEKILLDAMTVSYTHLTLPTTPRV